MICKFNIHTDLYGTNHFTTVNNYNLVEQKNEHADGKRNLLYYIIMLLAYYIFPRRCKTTFYTSLTSECLCLNNPDSLEIIKNNIF